MNAAASVTHGGDPPRPGESDPGLEVSVVMPCLNERETLGACIEQAQAAIEALGVRGEIIVADNGSMDGSIELAQQLGARVVAVEARGYGNALAGGVASARGAYVLMGDSDGSYDFGDLGVFLEKLRSGHDLVVGNRFKGGIDDAAMPWLHRHVGNPFLTMVSRRFYRTASGDVYCGLRAFRTESVKSLALHSGGMEYAIEMVVKATLAGMSVAEVPTRLAPDGRGRPPHLRTWRDGWRSLRFLLLYSPNWLFLYPGVASMAIGLAVMLALLPGQLRVGGVALDVHTLLYAGLGIVLGFQSVIFAVLARVFAVTEGLLPARADLIQRLGGVKLELGLAVGALLILGGLGGTIAVFLIWSARSFGRLDYPTTLRIVIPASTLIGLGFQIVLGSFFLGLLRMRRQ